MNRYLSTVFLVAICTYSCQVDESAISAAAESEVLDVQANRFEAMSAKNVKALETILSNDLTYTHTTGRTETKAEFLASLQSDISYQSIEPGDVRVRIYDSTAVVTGIAAMQVSSGEQNFEFSIRFIEVYTKKNNHWQLVAWQSTRLPDE